MLESGPISSMQIEELKPRPVDFVSYDPAGYAQNARCSPVTADTGLRKGTSSSPELTL